MIDFDEWKGGEHLRRIIAVLLTAGLLCFLAGCDHPDSLQLDLSRGYGERLKLIHLNASTEEKRERIEAFAAALEDAQPLDKDFSLFAYYPDYLLQIIGKDLSLTAIVDVNGDYVDFYFPDEGTTQLYRSSMTAQEFVKLVNHA